VDEEYLPKTGGLQPEVSVRTRIASRFLALLALIPAAACERAHPVVPEPDLEARVAAVLEREKARLVEDLGHYALVFSVEQEQLLAFMRQVRVFGDVDELVLGTAQGFESHGGGLLALLLELWRPEGRAAKLGDRFAFEASGAILPLSAIYASHRGQILLPAPLDTPQLARMLFRVPGVPPVEADAYQFLGLLLANEGDLERTWTNAQGQSLSVELVLDHARRHYLASRDSASEPVDHSNLHMVELLLAASRRAGDDPEPIQRRFFDVELQRRDFDPEDAALLLGHYTESLGRLVADPRVDWTGREKQLAIDWLGWLEATHFRDLDGIAPRHLTHLLLGLRLVRVYGPRIE
jgi:hypothetical protein